METAVQSVWKSSSSASKSAQLPANINITVSVLITGAGRSWAARCAAGRLILRGKSGRSIFSFWEEKLFDESCFLYYYYIECLRPKMPSSYPTASPPWPTITTSRCPTQHIFSRIPPTPETDPVGSTKFPNPTEISKVCPIKVSKMKAWVPASRLKNWSKMRVPTQPNSRTCSLTLIPKKKATQITKTARINHLKTIILLLIYHWRLKRSLPRDHLPLKITAPKRKPACYWILTQKTKKNCLKKISSHSCQSQSNNHNSQTQNRKFSS